MTFRQALAAIALCSSLLPAAAADEFPEGSARDLVASVCTGCHEARRFTAGPGYTPQDWANVVAMMRNVGAPIPDERVGEVTAYLARNWPEKPKPKAVVIPGPVQVEFHSWPVPTPGSRPHDPLATSDGLVWWSGQAANVLGRLDPRSGAMKEFALPTANSGPHGLIEDRAGNIWFAANWAAYLGKLDPKTGAVVEFPMPDPKAKDPHTPLFDRKEEHLWFTLQQANMVGRMTMATGEIKLVTMPTPRSQPYGMVLDSTGAVFFDEFGANRLARLDPVSLEIREFTLPNAGTRPSRLAITPDDVLWYTDYARGYLGMLDPRTGRTKEWQSPSGARTFPYAITALGGALWYVEGGSKPNLLVRFDPARETFQSWEIPTGGGVVRNMMPTRNGKGLVIAESGVNRVGLVTIK